MSHPKPCVRCKHYFDREWGGPTCHRQVVKKDHLIYGTAMDYSLSVDVEDERLSYNKHACGRDGQFFEPTLFHRIVTLFQRKTP